MDNKTIRRKNLEQLIAEYGGQKRLADRTGMNASMFSQIVNRTRDMGDNFARRLENSLGKTPGWLDMPQATEPSTGGVVMEEPEVYLHPNTRATLKQHPELDQIVSDLIALSKAGRGDIIAILNATVKSALENIKQNRALSENSANKPNPGLSKES